MTDDQYRQGDVFVIQVQAIPGDSTRIADDRGLHILAHGEATGHHHSVPGAEAAMLARGAERYLRTPLGTTLSHQEHAEIWLPAADYRVVIQREYHPEDVRNVLD